MAILNLDLSNVQPSTGVQDPVPAGWYKAAMTASELKPTKDGSGERLACEYTILEGQFANRKLYDGFNIRNPSQDAMRIAYEQLAAVGTAVGVLQIGQSEQLHNIPMDVKVKLVAAQMEMPPAGSPPGAVPTEKYPPKNEIVAYRRAGTGGPAVAAPAAPAFAPPPQAPAAAPAAAAWTPPAAPQPWAGAQQAPAAPAAPAPAAPAPAAMQPPAAPAAPAVTGLPVAPPWMAQPQA